MKPGHFICFSKVKSLHRLGRNLTGGGVPSSLRCACTEPLTLRPGAESTSTPGAAADFVSPPILEGERTQLCYSLRTGIPGQILLFPLPIPLPMGGAITPTRCSLGRAE